MLILHTQKMPNQAKHEDGVLIYITYQQNTEHKTQVSKFVVNISTKHRAQNTGFSKFVVKWFHPNRQMQTPC